MNINRQQVEAIKNRYPTGTRIQLDSMDDPQSVPAGTCGTVQMVDDIGNILMKWDNGRGLSLVPGEDQFHKIRDQEEGLAAPKLAEGLPELCFSTLPSTGDLICIRRGESGYYLSDWNTGDKQENAELADYNNERLSVTAAQRQAMECGSMHGWDIPGADPKAYEQNAPQMGGMTLG